MDNPNVYAREILKQWVKWGKTIKRSSDALRMLECIHCNALDMGIEVGDLEDIMQWFSESLPQPVPETVYGKIMAAALLCCCMAGYLEE